VSALSVMSSKVGTHVLQPLRHVLKQGAPPCLLLQRRGNRKWVNVGHRQPGCACTLLCDNKCACSACSSCSCHTCDCVSYTMTKKRSAAAARPNQS
jgi:hypothetical protein